MPDVSVSLTAGSSVFVTVDGSVGTSPTITNGGTANVTVSGAGAPGREIELRSSGGYIQWRYVGDATWANLLSLSSIVPTTVASHATSHAAGGSDAVTISISQVTGLQTALDAAQPAGTYVLTSDPRLSDAREWSAATVSQADAEAGTGTTRAAYTPLRVFQAVAAWWSGSAAKSKLDGIASGATANQTDAYLVNRSNHTGTQTASTISDFASAAASSVSWSTLTGVPSTFTPSAHAATHAASGSDPITVSTSQVSGLGSLATVTPTGTASSSTYLRGDATWATVPQPVGGTAEYASASAFPTPGVVGRLYVSAATNRMYRYSADDSVYVEVGTVQGTSTATTVRGHDLIPTLVLG